MLEGVRLARKLGRNPALAQFTATLPAGRSLFVDSTSGQKVILGSKANFKAMGYTGIDADFGRRHQGA